MGREKPQFRIIFPAKLSFKSEDKSKTLELATIKKIYYSPFEITTVLFGMEKNEPKRSNEIQDAKVKK